MSTAKAQLSSSSNDDHYSRGSGSATSRNGVGLQSDGRVGVQPSSNSSTSGNRNATTGQNVAFNRGSSADGGRSAGNPIDAACSGTVREYYLGTGHDGD